MWSAIKKYSAGSKFEFSLADLPGQRFSIWVNVSKTKAERDKGSAVTAAFQVLKEAIEEQGLDLKTYSKPATGEVICNRKIVARLELGKIKFVQDSLPEALPLSVEQLEARTQSKLQEKSHG